MEPIIEEATVWRNKNCLAKLMVNREKISEKAKSFKFGNLSVGIFREIIKYCD